MWFYSSLLIPIISALAIVLSKKVIRNIRAGVFTWATYSLSNIVVAIFAFRNGIPSMGLLFLIGILGSVFFYIVNKVFSLKAIRLADLSYIYPFSALAPLFTLIIAFLPPLSEKPSFLSIIGVLITVIGCYLLNINSFRQGILKPFKVIIEHRESSIMFFSVFIGSIVPIFDKLAIKDTFPQNTSFVLFIENFLIFLILLPVLYHQDKYFFKQVANNFLSLFLIGCLVGISSLLVMFNMGTTNIVLVQTILRTQVLFVLLFSWIFFKDKPKKEIIFGSIIMILGVVLIKLGA